MRSGLNNWILKEQNKFDELKRYYDEIQFIPTHILSNLYPFKNSPKCLTYYSKFKLITGYTELVEFFNGIKLKNNGEILIDNLYTEEGDDFLDKVKYVLSKLTRNLVYGVQSHKTFLDASTYFSEDKRCDCVSCSFYRFDFENSFLQLVDPNDDVFSRLQVGYIHYQIGNYSTAYKTFNEIERQCIAEKKIITLSIISHNIKHLKGQLRSYSEEEEGIAELETLDNRLHDKTAQKIIEWIENYNFYNQAFKRVQKTTSNIRDHYYSQLQGGVSGYSGLS